MEQAAEYRQGDRKGLLWIAGRPQEYVGANAGRRAETCMAELNSRSIIGKPVKERPQQ
jgi:hypothetical protein